MFWSQQSVRSILSVCREVIDQKLEVDQMVNISTDSAQIGFMKQESAELNQRISLTNGWFSGLPEFSESLTVVLIQVTKSGYTLNSIAT